MPTSSNDIDKALLSVCDRKWLSLVRRLEQVARTQTGLAAVTVTIFVDSEGHPIQWTSPRLTCLEPRGTADDFLAFLGKL